MFESLTEKLTGTLGKLNSRGRLSEKDVDEALREVRLAMLEADVNFKVARSFVESVKEKAMSSNVLESITAGQQVVKIANDELVLTLGGETVTLRPGADKPSVLLMVGLNGSGKTTTAGKLSSYLKKSGQPVSLVAADVHRPAAIDQLKVLGERVDVEVFEQGTDVSPEKIVKEGVRRSQKKQDTWTIVDTAGRFQVDDDLMQELIEIKKIVDVHEVLLVVDAMTGQEAVNVAEAFHEKIGLTGLVLTKMDGDARGGAALSITSVTGVPVKFIGVGERVDDLEIFHPDRLASRIIGMGDVLTLVEKAQASFDENQAKILEDKIKSATFDLSDFLDQMQAVKKMGPLTQVMEMIPGFSNFKNKLDSSSLDGSHLSRSEAIIRSMTVLERERPEIIGGSRRRRIAIGSGTTPQDVNQLLNQFKQVRKMMKEMSSPKGQQKMMRAMSQKGNPFGL